MSIMYNMIYVIYFVTISAILVNIYLYIFQILFQIIFEILFLMRYTFILIKIILYAYNTIRMLNNDYLMVNLTCH